MSATTIIAEAIADLIRTTSKAEALAAFRIVTEAVLRRHFPKACGLGLEIKDETITHDGQQLAATAYQIAIEHPDFSARHYDPFADFRDDIEAADIVFGHPAMLRPTPKLPYRTSGLAAKRDTSPREGSDA